MAYSSITRNRYATHCRRCDTLLAKGAGWACLSELDGSWHVLCEVHAPPQRSAPVPEPTPTKATDVFKVGDAVTFQIIENGRPRWNHNTDCAPRAFTDVQGEVSLVSDDHISTKHTRPNGQSCVWGWGFEAYQRYKDKPGYLRLVPAADLSPQPRPIGFKFKVGDIVEYELNQFQSAPRWNYNEDRGGSGVVRARVDAVQQNGTTYTTALSVRVGRTVPEEWCWSLESLNHLRLVESAQQRLAARLVDGLVVTSVHRGPIYIHTQPVPRPFPKETVPASVFNDHIDAGERAVRRTLREWPEGKTLKRTFDEGAHAFCWWFE